MKTNNEIVDTLLEAGYDIYEIKNALYDPEYIEDEGLTQSEVEDAFEVVCNIINNL